MCWMWPQTGRVHHSEEAEGSKEGLELPHQQLIWTWGIVVWRRRGEARLAGGGGEVWFLVGECWRRLRESRRWRLSV